MSAVVGCRSAALAAAMPWVLLVGCAASGEPSQGFDNGVDGPGKVDAGSVRLITSDDLQVVVDDREVGRAYQFLISRPGSYRLGGNLAGLAEADCIVVATSNVWLDLNGFSLTGSAGSGHGVRITKGCRNVRIERGHVRDWGGSGVSGWDGMNCSCTDLTVVDNGGDGVSLGVGGRVERVQASGNGGDGIRVDAAGMVTDCQAWRNGVGERGGDGIDAGDGAIIRHCTARDNHGAGFYCGTGAGVRDCVSRANKGIGVRAEPHATLAGLTVTYNDGDGIVVADGCVVSSCLVSEQEGAGIRVGSFGRISRNHCEGNGRSGEGAGIEVSGIDNRVSGNDVLLNVRGIVIRDGGNFISGNLSIHNGEGESDDYDIVPGNRVGPIVVAPAESGSPWSNFR